MVDKEIREHPFGRLLRTLAIKTNLKPVESYLLDTVPNGCTSYGTHWHHGQYSGQGPTPVKDALYLQFRGEQRDAIYDMLCKRYEALGGGTITERLVEIMNPRSPNL